MRVANFDEFTLDDKNNSKDVQLVIENCPQSLEEVNKELCAVYSKAPHFMHLKAKYHVLSPEIEQVPNVCVGGTFDHLHSGHKVLLSLSAYACSSKLVIGVSSDELLVNKKFSEALEPYNDRVQSVRDFLSFIAPHLKVDFYPLHNSFGPTIELSDLDALVVSEETLEGGNQVNDKRAELGLSQLKIITAKLVLASEAKISSTDIRANLCNK